MRVCTVRACVRYIVIMYGFGQRMITSREVAVLRGSGVVVQCGWTDGTQITTFLFRSFVAFGYLLSGVLFLLGLGF